ncbi:MAG TPA: hypothetical protein EYM84_00455 [Flavobacteriales bacterium]|nr:hypothetical protein [Flavobacteriales bacterium]HIN38724.1 hypothetical protein [Flavobacteriales bacterium]
MKILAPFHCFVFLFLVSVLTISCKKDSEIIPDNDAPYYDGIPTVVVENYINRLFIDLIGREPLNAEMASELAALKAAELSASARWLLINKLQNGTNFVQGDSSYKHAYYIRFYELSKARMLEGVSDYQINSEFISILKNNVYSDSVNGDFFNMEIAKQKIKLLEDVLAISEYYRLDSIEIQDVYARLLNNKVYDEINMNTFNFLRASFNDLFLRFPTQSEFDKGYEMVEYESPETLFGISGQNKGDYISIMINSKEFYEGMLRWLYQTLLAREPSTSEVYSHMTTFFYDHDIQKVQRAILQTDEYANFNY